MKLRIRYIVFFSFIAICLSIGTEVIAQDQTLEEWKKEYVPIDAKREEIQRYFGYELLLYRYLSAPYDVNLNTTQYGNFVEVGFLLIFFIPILILLLNRSRKLVYFSFLFYLFFLAIISCANSYVFSYIHNRIPTNSLAIAEYLSKVSPSSERFAYISAKIHAGILVIYKPLEALGLAVSGDSDHVTYPLVFTVFILLTYFLSKRFSLIDSNKTSWFFMFTWIYGFYWLTFGGGIIWYGYVLLASCYLLILKLIEHLSDYDKTASRIIYSLFIGLGFTWILMGSVDRISNVQPNVPQADVGKGILNPLFYDYATGDLSYEEVSNKQFPGITKALKRINSETESLIWRVGTSITYFIDNNNERIMMDNQAGVFYPLRVRYPDSAQLVDVMKASNFRFLLIDLNTAKIDQTPDRTLTRKFNMLMEFVKDNQGLNLLATDRVTQKNVNGQVKYYHKVFGQVFFPGSYAIYEIL